MRSGRRETSRNSNFYFVSCVFEFVCLFICVFAFSERGEEESETCEKRKTSKNANLYIVCCIFVFVHLCICVFVYLDLCICIFVFAERGDEEAGHVKRGRQETGRNANHM